MGIIWAAAGAVGGTLADQWLETINPSQIDNTILATYGIMVRKNDHRSSNRKRTDDVISNGSIIHVPENVYMLLVDGGKIIAGTDEPGYYRVDNSVSPSMFFRAAEGIETEGYSNTDNNAISRPGGFIHTIKDSWERFKFGGTTPHKQRVIYINKQEIPNIRFGTKNPVPYTDRVLVPGRVVPCKVTSFGTYSIKIKDPLLFYNEVCNKTDEISLTSNDMAEQYINEFLMAYASALASLSAINVMVSDIPMKTMELGQYMAEVLDKDWLSNRGFLIQSVGVAGISFDENTDNLLNKYANDSILFDPTARSARMTAGLASGLENAGSNEGGAMLGFAGIGMGMNAAGAMGIIPGQQVPQQQTKTNLPSSINGWSCNCGNIMSEDAAFCSKCGNKKPVQMNENPNIWVCSCGKSVSEGNFCPNCGKKRPESIKWVCSCGNETEYFFCSNCGNKKPDNSTSGYKCSCGWVPEKPEHTPSFCSLCGKALTDTDKKQ